MRVRSANTRDINESGTAFKVVDCAQTLIHLCTRVRIGVHQHPEQQVEKLVSSVRSISYAVFLIPKLAMSLDNVWSAFKPRGFLCTGAKEAKERILRILPRLSPLPHNHQMMCTCTSSSTTRHYPLRNFTMCHWRPHYPKSSASTTVCSKHGFLAAHTHRNLYDRAEVCSIRV